MAESLIKSERISRQSSAVKTDDCALRPYRGGGRRK